MVSFQCDGCADTVKKPQLDKHRQRCWASFSCIDCSTTFHNQDYKSHTSCISEEEKYQGALYRGPKKGQQNNNNTNPTSTVASSNATPADSPAPSESGTVAAAIHPSRLNQMAAGDSPAGRGGFERGGSGFGRGGFNARGRGGFRGGRGGAAGFNGAPATPRFSATGENKTAPESGMRSWGSAPTSDTEAVKDSPAPSFAAGDKKKQRKGDKGGCGSRANSNKPKGEGDAAAADEPAAKKRKRDEEGGAESSAAATPTPAGPPSDKTLKKLRKHMSKLEGKAGDALSLDAFLAQVAQGKDKAVDRAEVLQGVKVCFVDGRWQLSV